MPIISVDGTGVFGIALTFNLLSSKHIDISIWLSRMRKVKCGKVNRINKTHTLPRNTPNWVLCVQPLFTCRN